MKITAISPQIKDENRVNVSVDGKYRFSLDVFQLVDLGIKVGDEFDESKILELEQESQFGKLYGRALEYCLMRLHSAKEVKDYLYRKTRPVRNKLGKLRPGVSFEMTTRVFDRLVEKGYINDEKFAKFWAENRCVAKGVSSKKLKSELFSKGISSSIINRVLADSERDDKTELQKIVIKKRSKYIDDKKFISYLARLGFDYDDIKQALSGTSDF